MLHLYNSLTRKKELFQPINANKIGIYVCGITVYDRCHLGHARSLICFDMIVRFLRSQGFIVTYVRNITDIDDKIIKRANDLKISYQDLTVRSIAEMRQDLDNLKILPPDYEPKATDNIAEIITLITELLAKGFAYISDNGDVCYQVDKFKGYGKLSHKDIAGLQAGIRINIVKEKKSPLDFVLWKQAKPGEPSWKSPWGEGRPGWHIECSAMSMKTLGEHFDIHGGGIDLQFPHHENEIAQTEAISSKPLANYWLHTGMLQLNNEKMAKSTGNFLTIADVLEQEHPEVLRYFFLTSHYRSILNYSQENLQRARVSLLRLYQALKLVEVESTDVAVDDEWVQQFKQAMNDDFNTPAALAVLFKLASEIHKTKSERLVITLKFLGAILGLLQEAPAHFLQLGVVDSEKEEIDAFIQERLAARSAKQWDRADQIRNILAERGIELEDRADGTIWRRK